MAERDTEHPSSSHKLLADRGAFRQLLSNELRPLSGGERLQLALTLSNCAREAVFPDAEPEMIATICMIASLAITINEIEKILSERGLN